MGVIGDVGNDFKVVPAGTQGLHGEILGVAELDVIPLVVGDGWWLFLVMLFVLLLLSLLVSESVSRAGKEQAGMEIVRGGSARWNLHLSNLSAYFSSCHKLHTQCDVFDVCILSFPQIIYSAIHTSSSLYELLVVRQII